jgi:hypothetical protein
MEYFFIWQNKCRCNLQANVSSLPKRLRILTSRNHVVCVVVFNSSHAATANHHLAELRRKLISVFLVFPFAWKGVAICLKLAVDHTESHMLVYHSRFVVVHLGCKPTILQARQWAPASSTGPGNACLQISESLLDQQPYRPELMSTESGMFASCQGNICRLKFEHLMLNMISLKGFFACDVEHGIPERARACSPNIRGAFSFTKCQVSAS